MKYLYNQLELNLFIVSFLRYQVITTYCKDKVEKNNIKYIYLLLLFPIWQYRLLAVTLKTFKQQN